MELLPHLALFGFVLEAGLDSFVEACKFGLDIDDEVEEAEVKCILDNAEEVVVLVLKHPHHLAD